MGTHETELEAALRYRAELLMAIAERCLGEVLIQPDDLSGAQHLTRMETYSELRGLLGQVEALTAGILNRSSVSWDAIGGRMEVSRQAARRRLSTRADALFAEARQGAASADALARRLKDIQYTVREAQRNLAMSLRVAAIHLTGLRGKPGWWHDRLMYTPGRTRPRVMRKENRPRRNESG